MEISVFACLIERLHLTIDTLTV